MSWIKVRSHLATHPKVVRMAYALRTHPVRIIGALVYTWSVADLHADSEFLQHMTADALDQMVELPGFAEQMVLVGWLRISDDGLYLLNYQEHNGPTAKRRAAEAKRQECVRMSYADSTHSVRTDAYLEKDKNKRKSKNKNKTVIPPLPPKGESDEPTAELFTAHVEEAEVAASYDPSTADLPMPLDTPTFRQAWCQWWKYRRERRLPVYKPTTITERLNSFLAWGEASAVESIRQSISNGWAGLFEPKESKVFPCRREPTPLVSETMPPELVAQIFTDKPRREALAIQADIPPLVGLGVRCG